MLNSFVPGHLRHSRLQTFLRVLAIAFEVTLILALVSIGYGMASHPDLVRSPVGGLVVKVLWSVFGVSFLCVTKSRYAAVSERAREIGILKMLGASPSHIVNLLFQETLLIAVSGTVLGIAMACGTKWLIAYAVPIF